jgi:hypothetical protein
MKSCQRHYGHITSLSIVLQRSHFELVYGQEVILSMEVNLDALQIAQQNELSAIDYRKLMLDRLDKVSPN